MHSHLAKRRIVRQLQGALALVAAALFVVVATGSSGQAALSLPSMALSSMDCVGADCSSLSSDHGTISWQQVETEFWSSMTFSASSSGGASPAGPIFWQSPEEKDRQLLFRSTDSDSAAGASTLASSGAATPAAIIYQSAAQADQTLHSRLGTEAKLRVPEPPIFSQEKPPKPYSIGFVTR
jgi:hypothetical protein